MSATALVNALKGSNIALTKEILALSDISTSINDLFEFEEAAIEDFDLAEKNAPLHVACLCSSAKIVSILLEAGARDDVKDSDGKFPVHKACESSVEPLQKMKMLVDVSSGNIERVQDGFAEQTPLHRAAIKGNADVVEYLLRMGANVNAIDIRGETALHKAAFVNKVQVMKVLIEKGVSLNEQDREGDTALHIASSYSNLDAVKLLASNSACDVSIKNGEGETALDVAIVKVEPDIVDFLSTSLSNSSRDAERFSDANPPSDDVAAILDTAPLPDDKEYADNVIIDAVRWHFFLLRKLSDWREHMDFLFAKKALRMSDVESIEGTQEDDRMRRMLHILLAKQNDFWASTFLQSLRRQPSAAKALALVLQSCANPPKDMQLPHGEGAAGP